jgi:hypothetical protein
MDLTYRFATDQDIPEVARLWSEETDWGIVTPGLPWFRNFLEPPYGKVRWLLAIDASTAAVVGTVGFIPWPVRLPGSPTELIRGVRPTALVLSKAVRGTLSRAQLQNNPLVQAFLAALQQLNGEGFQLLYGLPDPRWLSILRRIPRMNCRRFGLSSMPLPVAGLPRMPFGFTTTELVRWDRRVDQLWTCFSERLPLACSERNAAALRWKVGGGDYSVQGIYAGAELVGLVASREKGDRQWLICDLLTRDDGDSLRATLAAVCNLAQCKASAEGTRAPRKVSILRLPYLDPILQEFGFVQDNYTFTHITFVLDPKLIGLGQHDWYLSANE